VPAPDNVKLDSGDPAQRGLGERLRAALATHRIEEVARKLGVSASAIYNWISGANEPSLGKLFALAEITRTSPAWLIVGQWTPDSIPGYGRPLYKTKAPPFAFENRWVELNVGKDGYSLILVEVPDDSMEPTMKKGDFLLVRASSEMAPVNGIYAVALREKEEEKITSWEDWTLVPKRVEWSSREDAILKCDNPAYPLVIKLNTRLREQDIEIAGPVVWHGRLI
jgi:transcriptional regulator with XRE-family HTH domain